MANFNSKIFLLVSALGTIDHGCQKNKIYPLPSVLNAQKDPAACGTLPPNVPCTLAHAPLLVRPCTLCAYSTPPPTYATAPSATKATKPQPAAEQLYVTSKSFVHEYACVHSDAG